MKEETIEIVDLMVQEEYGRPLSEHEKKFLRQVTKETYVVFPRQSGRRSVVDFMLMAGWYYEAMTEGRERAKIRKRNIIATHRIIK